jgi:hypothetical protein
LSFSDEKGPELERELELEKGPESERGLELEKGPESERGLELEKGPESERGPELELMEKGPESEKGLGLESENELEMTTAEVNESEVLPEYLIDLLVDFVGHVVERGVWIHHLERMPMQL